MIFISGLEFLLILGKFSPFLQRVHSIYWNNNIFGDIHGEFKRPVAITIFNKTRITNAKL
jgi:hypothetical protein